MIRLLLIHKVQTSLNRYEKNHWERYLFDDHHNLCNCLTGSCYADPKANHMLLETDPSDPNV